MFLLSAPTTYSFKFTQLGRRIIVSRLVQFVLSFSHKLSGNYACHRRNVKEKCRKRKTRRARVAPLIGSNETCFGLKGVAYALFKQRYQLSNTSLITPDPFFSWTAKYPPLEAHRRTLNVRVGMSREVVDAWLNDNKAPWLKKDGQTVFA